MRWPWPPKVAATSEDDPPFVADAPIRSAEQDTLGRVEFANSLAAIVAKWRGDTSLVIAVRSPWGNGKTSVKNLVLEQLGVIAPNLRSLQFNPWQYSTSDTITAAFYRELRIALGKNSDGHRVWKRQRLLRKYGRYFTAASSGLTAAGKHVTPVMTAMTVLGLITFTASFITQTQVVRWGSLLVAGVGIAGLVGPLLTFLGSPEEQIPQQHVRAELEALLRELKQPLLIVIDDLDRLDQEAIRLVIRHVKVNADLPNITYLLLFQREIVEAALDAITNGQGRAYLDKIILAPFDLPPVERERLEKVLFGALDKVIEALPANNGFNSSRWGNAYHGGLKYYFTNLRDVHRFAASLAVQMTLHVTAKMVEVNIIDIFILETLRLFEPDVYANVANNQALVIGTGRLEEADRQRALSLLNGAKNPKAAQALLVDLFPKLSSAFSNLSYGESSYGEWAKTRRVAVERNFSRYFALRLPDNTISSSEFEELLENAGNRPYLDAAFADLKQRGLLDSLMSRLDEINTDLPTRHIETFAGALFDIGEELEDGAFLAGATPYTACWRTVSWYFHSIEDAEERSQRFLSTLEGSQGLSVPATLIDLDDDRRKKEDRQRLLLTDEDLPRAKELWFEKLEAALRDPATFLAQPHALSNLYSARRFGKGDEIKAWAGQVTQDPSLLVPFLRAFVTTSHSWGLSDHVAHRNDQLSIKYLRNFVDTDELSTRLAKLDKSALPEQAVALIEEFERKRHKPISDDPNEYDD